MRFPAGSDEPVGEAPLDWSRLAAHGAGEPFEPVLYSTRVGFVAGLVAMVVAEILLWPFAAAFNWVIGAGAPNLSVPGSIFIFAITFPFVARGTFKFLSQRYETRTAAYALVGGVIYLAFSVLSGNVLTWLPIIVGGAVATAAYRVYNLEATDA